MDKLFKEREDDLSKLAWAKDTEVVWKPWSRTVEEACQSYLGVDQWAPAKDERADVTLGLLMRPQQPQIRDDEGRNTLTYNATQKGSDKREDASRSSPGLQWLIRLTTNAAQPFGVAPCRKIQYDENRCCS